MQSTKLEKMEKFSRRFPLISGILMGICFYLVCGSFMMFTIEYVIDLWDSIFSELLHDFLGEWWALIHLALSVFVGIATYAWNKFFISAMMIFVRKNWQYLQESTSHEQPAVLVTEISEDK